MRRVYFREILLAVLVLTASTAEAKKKPEVPIDPGPEPSSWEHFKSEGERAVLQGFFDPSSAQFQWDNGYTGGYWKPVLQKKVPGWFTCGLVNGKNRMGGYVGFRRFVVVMFNDRVVFSEVGDGGTYDFVAGGCQQAIAKGLLGRPPADGPPPSTKSKAPASSGAYGLKLSIVPDGAYVSEVATDSVASRAGLLPGMVISHINGLPTKGLEGSTIADILEAADGGVTLSVIGKGDLKIGGNLPK